MIKPAVLDALNKQLSHELSNSYAYLAVAAYFEDQVYGGFAAYFRKQAEEERAHGMKIYEFILDCNEKPVLAAIEAPQGDFASPLEALKAVRDLEKKTSGMINAAYALALKDNDLPAQNLLKWFVDEQVEEEKWSEEFVTTGERIGTQVGAWYMFDHRVSKLAEKA